MKALSLLPWALAASAFVIPDPDMAQALEVQTQESAPSFWDNIKDPEKIWEELENRFNDAADLAKNKFDEAVETAYETAGSVYDTAVNYREDFQEAFATDAWLESGNEDLDLFEGEPPHGLPGPPHKGPPHRGPPHGGPPDHKKPPHRKPHHPPHHHKPNLTVYELISKSKYTTKLAKAIDEFPDLVELLNGTTANFTLFAPTDKAFEKIPKHAPKPPKEFLKKLLTYHVSPEFYPAGRVLVTRTIPTAFAAEFIGGEPQRLSTQVGLRGLTVNFYSRIVAVNIFGTNGVIHGIDSILIPPPKVVDILSIVPAEFSTLELALFKTGLYELYNDTSLHTGGTLFAPSNFAFRMLGPRINSFLFSPYGLKYLKALLLYHSVPEITLYSDAVYKPDEKNKSSIFGGCGHGHGHRIPKGLYHIDLPTGLGDKYLSVDIGRYGRLIDMRINGFTHVSVLDGIAADGVLHLMSRVLIPPKVPGGPGVSELTEDMSIEDLQELLDPYVESDWEFEL